METVGTVYAVHKRKRFVVLFNSLLNVFYVEAVDKRGNKLKTQDKRLYSRVFDNYQQAKRIINEWDAGKA